MTVLSGLLISVSAIHPFGTKLFLMNQIASLQNCACSVLGTKGDAATSKAVHQLAVYIANLFFLTSDTLAPVVKDSDLQPKVAGE